MELSELLRIHTTTDQDLTVEIFEHPVIQDKFLLFERYIRRVSRKNWDECRAIAYDSYVEALNHFDEDRGGFTSCWWHWTRACIHKVYAFEYYNGIFKENYQITTDHQKVHALLLEDPNMTNEEIRERLKFKSPNRASNMRRVAKSPTVLDFEADNSINDIACHDEPYNDEGVKIGDMVLSDDMYLALESLTKPQRDTLCEYYGLSGHDGKTLKEIADSLDISYQAVHCRCKIGLEKMREYFKNKDNDSK